MGNPMHDLAWLYIELYILDAIVYVGAFLAGISIGSFLGCMIYRVRHKLPILRERSYCPACDHKLTISENIPVFAYIWQRGRSRCCNARLSPIYLWAETACGILGVAIAWALWR